MYWTDRVFNRKATHIFSKYSRAGLAIVALGAVTTLIVSPLVGEAESLSSNREIIRVSAVKPKTQLNQSARPARQGGNHRDLEVTSLGLETKLVPAGYGQADTDDTQILSPVLPVEKQIVQDPTRQADQSGTAESQASEKRAAQAQAAAFERAETATPQPRRLAPGPNADQSITPIPKGLKSAAQDPHRSQGLAKLDGARAKRVQSGAAKIEAEVATIGLTWDKTDADAEVKVTYRLQKNGTWGQWEHLMGHGNEFEQSEPVQAGQVPGTEPLFLIDVQAVEVVAETRTGRNLRQPKLTVIRPDGHNRPEGNENTQAVAAEKRQTKTKTTEFADSEKGFETAQANAGFNQALVAEKTTLQIPGSKIHSRAEWGADETKMTWKPQYAKALKGALVHHTEGGNNYTKDQVPSVIRSIYQYHAITRGWGDIGYNVLVDKYGGAWEGRAGGLARNPIGAHSFGSNSLAFGISVLGSHSYIPPTEESLETVERVLAWKLKSNNLPAYGSWSVTYNGKTWHPNRIDGHRSARNTSCPGEAFMAKMPQIRQAVHDYLTKGVEVPENARWGSIQLIGWGWSTAQSYSVGDFNGDGANDYVIVDSAGGLRFYAGSEAEKISYRGKIGHGWSNYDSLSGGVDWNGDGRNDIIARNTRSGELFAYYGNGSGGFSGVAKIGVGWQGFSFITAAKLGGKSAVYTINQASKQLFVYPGNGRGGFQARRLAGYGWGRLAHFQVTPAKRGGEIRVFAAWEDGSLSIYRVNSISGGLSSGRKIGQGWEIMRKLMPGGNVLSPGVIDAVRKDGKLLRYRFLD